MKKYRNIRDNYLQDVKVISIEELNVKQLHELSQLFELEVESLPSSYRKNREKLIVWLNNWITLEIISDLASKPRNN